jgi:hypothetical protein
MVSVLNANLALSLLPRPQAGSVDFSMLAGGSTGAVAVGPGDVFVALKQAEDTKAKQLADVGKQADVQKDLERYERVLREAETFDDVLADPVARKVLMKANGLGDQADYIGLAKKAMASDPRDPNSLAARLSKVNGAWLAFAQTYDVANSGLERLRPNTEGFKGSWRLSIQRDGEPIEARLEIRQTANGGWSARVDGDPVPISVAGEQITIDLLWEDAGETLHTTRLTGSLNGGGLAGGQADDGKPVGSWSAEAWSEAAVREIKANYIAERRLDMLDQRLPGLGTALLFKEVAASLDTPLKVLGSQLGREVVTTALGLPKQIAVQSVEAQVKAVESRLDVKKLKDPDFVERLVQRYLLATNGLLGGVSA